MIGIITWITWKNFGSFLQAYALQNILKQLGYKSRIISDARFTNEANIPRTAIQWLKLSLRHPRYAAYLKIKPDSFRRFAKKYLKIDYSWRDVNCLNKRYDTFICGSDQIWSPILPSFHNGFYFASFATNGHKLIAYAPSLGVKSSNSNYALTVKPWLSKFTNISIREADGAEIIKQITGREDIKLLPDPTLMIPSSHWISFAGDRRIKEDYILCYFLTFNESYLRQASDFAHSKNKKLVAIDIHGLPQSQIPDEYAKDCAPDDFISLIYHSYGVITDSFHGTIFSIICRKNFITMKRFKDSDEHCQNSRLENLFKLLNIDGKFISEITPDTSMDPFNWDSVEYLINQQRDSAMDFLRNSLL